MTLSLSTMWAQQDRFVADMHLFVEEALALGYDSVEVSHATPEGPFERLMSYPNVPISSIHAPAPLVFDAHRNRNSALNLASTDEREREEAVAYVKTSIDHAHWVGGKVVVVHLGAIGHMMFDEELQLRRLYDSGTREGERVEELRARVFAMRAEQIGPWLEQAVVTAQELAEYCEERGVIFGIENRLHYHEIPQPDEAAELLEEFPTDVAGYVHDVGHAEVQWRLGLVDKRRWLDVNGTRCVEVQLHDVSGIGDHRAPGDGDVEWDYLAQGLPASALRVFEINQRQPPEAVATAIPYLRERGVIM
jgi:sugar phosphate isomerase/epimerase